MVEISTTSSFEGSVKEVATPILFIYCYMQVSKLKLKLVQY